MNNLSIITVTYNDGKNLLKTINSIKKQKNKKFELIIIDGNSSDNTEEIIKLNMDTVDVYVSENDRGIYDAMNKGINLSKGDYLFFLNAGDIFYDDMCVDKIYSSVINRNFDIGYFNIALIKGRDKKIKKQPEVFHYKYILYNNICHQSMVINKKIFSEFGLYNIKNKVFADFEFLFKVVKQNSKLQIKGSKEILSCFDLNGISSTAPLSYKIKERFKIIKKYGGAKDILIYIVLNMIYKPFDYLITRR